MCRFVFRVLLRWPRRQNYMHTYLLYNIYEHAEVVRNEPEDPLLLTTDTHTHTHTREEGESKREF